MSERGQRQLLAGAGDDDEAVQEGGRGRRRRRAAAAAEEEEGHFCRVDPETGSRQPLGGTAEAYEAFLEGGLVLYVEPVLGQAFKLAESDSGEVRLEPWADAGEEEEGEDGDGDGGTGWDEWEAEVYEERDPERLIRLYLSDPGKGTLSDLGLIAGASFTEAYVDERMTSEERERWNSLYPHWRREIRDESEETQELMRKYLFNPSSANLEEAVYLLGMDFVRDYAEDKGDVLRQDHANASIWQTTARLLQERMVGDDLVQRHVDNPEAYPLEEVVSQLGAEYVTDFAERAAWHLERLAPALQEDASLAGREMVWSLVDATAPGPVAVLASVIRVLAAAPGAREHALPGPSWREGFAARRNRQWPFAWSRRSTGPRGAPF